MHFIGGKIQEISQREKMISAYFGTDGRIFSMRKAQRVTVMVSEAPSSLAALIFPLCAATMARAIERPMP